MWPHLWPFAQNSQTQHGPKQWLVLEYNPNTFLHHEPCDLCSDSKEQLQLCGRSDDLWILTKAILQEQWLIRIFQHLVLTCTPASHGAIHAVSFRIGLKLHPLLTPVKVPGKTIIAQSVVIVIKHDMPEATFTINLQNTQPNHEQEDIELPRGAKIAQSTSQQRLIFSSRRCNYSKVYYESSALIGKGILGIMRYPADATMYACETDRESAIFGCCHNLSVYCSHGYSKEHAECCGFW